MATAMPSLMSSIKKLSPKGWAMIGGALAATIVFFVVLMHFASSPSYATLQTGLDPAQTGKITSALSTQGIAYKLQNNGTALAVESSKTAQARVALATAGLLSNQQPGFTLLDKQKLGQSNFQQQVTYTRALEGQLASTIETIDGISSAQVNLVLPNSQDQLFSDQTQAATASVLLSGSDSLQSSSVRGIAQLVSSSVPGLRLDKVTVTGPDGSLLWPNSSADNGGLPGKQQLQQRYDSAMAAQASAMLAQTLGAGKAQVVVNADLDANRATQEKLTYAKKGTPLTQQTGTESLRGGGAGGGGGAGTTANIPAFANAGGAGGGSNSNYRNKTSNTNFGVDKTVTHSVVAPGTVTRQTVSVLVDKSVPAASIPAIRQAVSNAVGLQKGRDQLSIAQLPFATPKAAPAAVKANPMMHYAKYGVLGLLALVFLVFAGRSLRKREREPFGEPTWLNELQAPRSLASLEPGRQQGDVTALTPHIGVARRQVEDLAHREPERVAAHLRTWMAED